MTITIHNFLFLIIFIGPVRGLEKIWIIGDEFCDRSYDHYYKRIGLDRESNKTFAFTNFEMRDFFSSEYKSHNRSAVGRILNNLINALNEHNTLPKLIVMVIDNDMVKHINESGTFMKIRDIVKWLPRESCRAVLSYKEYLPVKAKCNLVPQFLWMCPPTHRYFNDNRQRYVL